MEILHPDTPAGLAEALAAAGAARQRIRLGGAFTKNRMGGPVGPADAVVSTDRLTRVLQYEPKDLTISVEAGLRVAELNRVLAENRQMVPLDPPFGAQATVGGVLAANCTGPRRRLYGTGRDLVIGMKFATLRGELIQTGGMVVKNVAGLDMGKLLVGSFGTLAAMAVVNFKLIPMPPETGTFAQRFETAVDLLEARDRLVRGVLQPAAVDLLNPAAARRVGLDGFVLLVQAGGNRAVMARYASELTRAEALDDGIWERVREFTPEFLGEHASGMVERRWSTLEGMRAVMELKEPVVARGGNGVAWVYHANGETYRGAGVMEWGPEDGTGRAAGWPEPGAELDVMRRIKNMFDPAGLLNAGRLYGRI
ncbi:MAG: FAD-binding protein [Acidobacteria bacterium]|nr:FAD-binding protein [Acidobacteriota bacterium]